MDSYEIVLADDHPIFRKGVRSIIEEVPGLQILGEANDGLELLQLLQQTSPQLVILDLSMPNYGGIEVIKEIKRIYPQVKMLVLTMHKTRAHLYRALSLQVQGYLLKEDTHTDLIAAIKVIRGGGTFISTLLVEKVPEILAKSCRGDFDYHSDLLSGREKQILSLLAEGKTNQEIADLLFIGLRTVHTHRNNIKMKLDIKKSTELIKYAIQKGYTTMDPVTSPGASS